MTTESSRTWTVEVLPHQVYQACRSLERSHCRIIPPLQDGRNGTKRITYTMPDLSLPTLAKE